MLRSGERSDGEEGREGRGRTVLQSDQEEPQRRAAGIGQE